MAPKREWGRNRSINKTVRYAEAEWADVEAAAGDQNPTAWVRETSVAAARALNRPLDPEPSMEAQP